MRRKSLELRTQSKLSRRSSRCRGYRTRKGVECICPAEKPLVHLAVIVCFDELRLPGTINIDHRSTAEFSESKQGKSPKIADKPLPITGFRASGKRSQHGPHKLRRRTYRTRTRPQTLAKLFFDGQKKGKPDIRADTKNLHTPGRTSPFSGRGKARKKHRTFTDTSAR